MAVKDHKDDHHGLPLPRRYWAILSLCFSTGAVVLDGAIATIALPTISQDLGISASSSVHVVTIYQLVSVIALIPMAALGDRFGHRRVYRYGLGVLTISVLLCFFVKGLLPLLALRFAQAIGASMALSVSSALLREVYPSRILGRGLALNSLIVSISASAAPTLGGAVLAHMRWPMVFACAVPFAMAALFLSRAMPDPERRSITFDSRAAVLYGFSMGMLYGAIDGNIGFPPLVRILLLILAIFVGIRLVRHENKVERPVIPVDLLKSPPLALSSLGGLLCFTSSMCVLVMLPFRLGMIDHLTTPQIGMVISVWPLTMLMVSPAIGLLSDYLPARLVGTLGMAIAALGLSLFAQAGQLDMIGLYWHMGLCALGFSFFTGSNARFILSISPRDRAASVGSLISTGRMTGQSLGAILAGTILSAGWISHGWAFYIPAAIAALAGLCSFARVTNR